MRNWAPFRRVMLATTALVPLGIVAAAANPLGPNVVGGGATVTGIGTSQRHVNQSTPRAIINWNSFNIGAGETTRFVQPDASSIALNRVTGGLGPSMINGMLTANGRVFLVNPDGVMISSSGTINTAGFLATHQRHQQRQLHGGQVPLQHSRPAGRLDRQRGHDQLAQPRLRRAGRAGRAQQRHHHRAVTARSGLPPATRSRSISTATS